MELSIGVIIKFIIATIVIVAVVYGLYLVVQNQVSDSFKGIGLDESVKLFLALL